MSKDKRSIVVYISGKYSGDIENNIRVARQYAIQVWERGYTALCPHLNTVNFERDCTCEYNDYIMGDLALLEFCDIILMLPDWQSSTGAKIEHDFASKKGLKIIYSLEEL